MNKLKTLRKISARVGIFLLLLLMLLLIVPATYITIDDYNYNQKMNKTFYLSVKNLKTSSSDININPYNKHHRDFYKLDSLKGFEDISLDVSVRYNFYELINDYKLSIFFEFYSEDKDPFLVYIDSLNIYDQENNLIHMNIKEEKLYQKTNSLSQSRYLSFSNSLNKIDFSSLDRDSLKIALALSNDKASPLQYIYIDFEEPVYKKSNSSFFDGGNDLMAMAISALFPFLLIYLIVLFICLAIYITLTIMLRRK